MEYLSTKIANYLTKNYELNNIDNARVKYSIEVILNEMTKLILLLITFNIIGELRSFIYAFIVLLLFRPLLGGLHLGGFVSCYIFTMLFFGAIISLAQGTTINIYFLTILFIYNLIAMIKFRSPLLIDKPLYTKLQTFSHKNIPIMALCFHFVLYLLMNDNLYLKISIWTITLQSIQLIVAKGVRYYEKRKN